MLVRIAEPGSRDAALAAEGWERRFTADAERAREAAELYRQLGYELRVEPAQPDQPGDGCAACHAAASFQTIYTRKKSS